MKRRALLWTVIAGILVFLAVLVRYLPASWFASWLPPQVRCAELGGSVWHGECVGLTLQDARLGDATWNLSPLRALMGRLVGDVDVRGSLQSGRADFDVGLDGAGELGAVKAQFPMDPSLSSAFPANQSARIAVDLQRVTLSAGFVPRQLQGTVQLLDYRQLSPEALTLGSYEVAFDGNASAQGAIVGKLRDLGGPFAVEGSLTLTPPNNYLGSGLITGRTADAERIVRQITFGARPDASGRAPFNFEGTY